MLRSASLVVLIFTAFDPVIAATPADSYFQSQWYLRRIQATDAWDINTDSRTIVIAVIDSGVQWQHPDLEANIWINPKEISDGRDNDGNGLIDDIHGWDFVNDQSDPSPKFKSGFTESGIIHGTIVAGIAAAVGNNNEGITGVSWNSKIMPLKALDDQGNGDMRAVIKAIDYATVKGANIINLSFVGFSYSAGLKDAIERAHRAGVLVVSAAGNEQALSNGLDLNQHPIYPACLRDNAGKKLVVGVAATDGLDQKTPFSGYGDRCIDIAAPGVSFYSTTVYAPDKSAAGDFFNLHYDGYWSGTSMAVAVVSGALALIEGTNPGLSPEQALTILLSSADTINQLNPDYINQLGRGRVNLAQAVLTSALTIKNRTAHFALTPATSGGPLVEITDQAGRVEKDFFAFPTYFTGGINIAAGDLDGDGSDEIIVAPKSDREADIRIFNESGVLLHHFLAYPYDFKGGVNLAVSDLDGDGKAEIITVPAFGRSAEVKIFSQAGHLLRSFLAYPENFKGGVNLASADITDSPGKEIVTAPGKGGIPQVKTFSKDGRLISHFIAGLKSNTSGLRVAAGDVDGNPRRRQAEIIVSHMAGEPTIAIYDFRGNRRQQWDAYTGSFTGDVRVLASDLNRDGFTDIITMPGPGGGPHVRVFDRTGEIGPSFYAFLPDFTGGVNGTVLLTK